MDIRYLSLGKLDFSINTSASNNSYLYSDFYFDWIKLERIDFNPEISISQNILFSHSAAPINETDEYENPASHMQETMLLVSDLNADDFLSKISKIYVSMINIPMWNESLFSNSKEYSVLRKKGKEIIEEIIDSSKCRLYYSFDHCDYVLIADGTQISMKEYVKILWNIRDSAIFLEDKNVMIPIVHDITTIYGSDGDYLNNNEESLEKMDLIVKLSLKQPKHKTTLIKKLEKIKKCEDATMYFDTIGRFDFIISWKDISIQEFNLVINELRTERQNYFTYCIHMGISLDDLKFSNYDFNDKYLTSGLLAQRKDTLKEIKNTFNFERPLFNALCEVEGSINARLKNGFAQYYLLSFYESFYSVVDFIQREVNNSHRKPDETEQIKKSNEKIVDIHRAYFGYLNALNTSTIHSDRQFLQIDSYQMLYFDAPPKLIAFYTAIANKIVSMIEVNTNNEYTFLITPDFKEDIFVKSLTEDRTINGEHNILIIHMNEESMYDITNTIKIITHEIYHHTGQTEEFRKIRAKVYLKCCIALVLSQCEDICNFIFYQADKNEDKYKIFMQLIDKVYIKMFTDDTIPVFPNQWLTKNNENLENAGDDILEINEILYYSDFLLTYFVNYISDVFSQENNCIADILNDIAVNVCNDSYEDFGYHKVADHYSNDHPAFNVMKEYSVNMIAQQAQHNIRIWLANHNDIKTYREIQYAFREGFADYCMLMLLFDCEHSYVDTVSKYKEILKKCCKGNIIEEEKPRIISVIKALNHTDDNWVKNFDEANLPKNTADKIVSRNKQSGTDNSDGIFIIQNNGGIVEFVVIMVVDY